MRQMFRPTFLPSMTVLENILLPLQYRTSREPIGEVDEAKAVELAQMVGLGDRLDHKPFQLSGGQQQRVATSRNVVSASSHDEVRDCARACACSLHAVRRRAGARGQQEQHEGASGQRSACARLRQL